MGTMNSSLLSSKKQDWCTPQEFYDALDAEFHFTLDAAATKKNAKCSAYFTPEDDALKKAGKQAALFSAIRHTDGKYENGCAKRSKNHETGK